MTMKFDENTRGIWYCLLIPGEQDFLMSLNKVDEGHYKLIYRFRYYNGDDPWDDEDTKNWYSGEIHNDNEEQVIEGLHEIVRTLAEEAEAEFTELLRSDRPLEEFIDEFREQDFVHEKAVH